MRSIAVLCLSTAIVCCASEQRSSVIANEAESDPATTIPANTQAGDADLSVSFEVALALAVETPDSADYTTLRHLWVKHPATSAYYHMNNTHRDSRKAMFETLGREDYRSTYQAALKILDICYLDIEGHFYAEKACEALGMPECSIHAAFANGLIESILASGDGSESNPYEVVSLPEEWAVMSWQGYPRSGEQSVTEKDGKVLDVIVSKHVDTAEPRTFYFDITQFYRK